MFLCVWRGWVGVTVGVGVSVGVGCGVREQVWVSMWFVCGVCGVCMGCVWFVVCLFGMF